MKTFFFKDYCVCSPDTGSLLLSFLEDLGLRSAIPPAPGPGGPSNLNPSRQQPRQALSKDILPHRAPGKTTFRVALAPKLGPPEPQEDWGEGGVSLRGGEGHVKRSQVRPRGRAATPIVSPSPLSSPLGTHLGACSSVCQPRR